MDFSNLSLRKMKSWGEGWRKKGDIDSVPYLVFPRDGARQQWFVMPNRSLANRSVVQLSAARIVSERERQRVGGEKERWSTDSVCLMMVPSSCSSQFLPFFPPTTTKSCVSVHPPQGWRAFLFPLASGSSLSRTERASERVKERERVNERE